MRFRAKTSFPRQGVPIVAVLGRPNVGKSTLFNRIVGGRPALVQDTPGVTRDRRYRDVEFEGYQFTLVDTGGLDPEAPSGAITDGIHRQARRAIEEADLLMLVVDARAGLTPVDHDVVNIVRKSGRKVIVAANKIDGPKQDHLVADLYSLGLGEVYPVSAAHGRGVETLLDALLAGLPESAKISKPSIDDAMGDEDEPGEGGLSATLGGDATTDAPPEGVDGMRMVDDRPGDDVLRLAFVGRPNAGKSSLVNRYVGEERVLVHDQPGTTTDPVDTPFSFDGRDYLLIDTAGMRKRARVEDPTEKIAVSMAIDQLSRADVVCLVIDAMGGPGDQDAKIARHIHDAGRGICIVVNKADQLPEGAAGVEARKKLLEQIEMEFGFIDYAPVRFVSARTGGGLSELLEQVNQCFTAHGQRVSTSDVNRFFEDVLQETPPPLHKGKAVRIHYLTQAQIHPPAFVLWANFPDRIPESYRRFLENQLRERFGFEGTPLRIFVRAKRKTQL